MDTRLSLSTTWRQGRFEHLRDFFEAATECGFQSYHFDQTVSLKEIADLSLPEGQIIAIDIPCPAHPRNAEAQMASLDRYEKEAAREAAGSSFEFAFDIKAEVLIAHLGRVEISPRLELALYDAFRQEGADSHTCQDLRKELIETRARNAPPHLKSALYDVEFLANRAVDLDLKLAIVTPNHYSGFPLPEELHIIMAEFGSPVFYWHDVGHAHRFDTLGLMPRDTWQGALTGPPLGLHLHDVQGLRDGLPPQENGEVDFDSIAANIPPDIYLNCTFRPTVSREEVKRSQAQFQTIFSQASVE